MNRTCLIGTSLRDSPVSAHFFNLAEELAVRGWRCFLLVDGRKTAEVKPDANPAVLTWPSPRPVNLADLRFLFSLVSRTRPACVIGNFSSTNLMMLVGWVLRVPLRIAWCHTLMEQIGQDVQGSRLRLRLLQLRKRFIYTLATRIVAVSFAVERELRRRFMLSERKVIVWHNMIPCSVSPGAYEHESGTFVCAGRFSRTKGQDVVIRALTHVRKTYPHVSVDFIGSGPERERCMQLAQEIGVSDACRFLGTVPHTDVLEKMSAASAVLVPSRSEAFGYVVLEAMVAGRPVIASNTGGIPEIVRDGIEGILVPPQDPEAMAAAMMTLLGDPALRAGMGTAARKRCIEAFNEEDSIAAQADWIENACGFRPVEQHAVLQ